MGKNLAEISEIGQSEWTFNKQEDFRSVIRMNIRLTIAGKNGWAAPFYRYFDLNAGCGQYNGIVGSPLIFMQEAESLEVDYKAILIEKETENCMKLKDISSGFNGHIEIANMDHVDYFSNWRPIDSYMGKLRGAIYHDPNGMPSFDLLADISRMKDFRHIDMIVYLSATTVKRVRGAFPNRYKALLDSLKIIDKPFWKVRFPKGHQQWTFLIGTRWDKYPDWANRGFHDLRSPNGKEIIEKLSLTAKEFHEQHQNGLFGKQEQLT